MQLSYFYATLARITGNSEHAMNAGTAAFNWQEYLVIREPEDSKYYQPLKQIIDRVARTTDGQLLIRRAYDVSGSGKHRIEVATSPSYFTLRGKAFAPQNWGSAGAADTYGEKDSYEGKLTIDMGYENGIKGQVTPEGNVIVSSQTDTFVHELFHLADPNLLPHIAKEKFKAVLMETLAGMMAIDGTAASAQSPVVQAAADVFIREHWPPDTEMKIDTIAAEILRRDEFQSLTQSHSITVSPPKGALFAGIRGSVTGNDSYPPPPAGFKAVHPFLNGAWRHEEQCVKYTDRFMAKYFGQPPRQGYGNLVALPKGTVIPEEPALLATPTPDDRLPPYKPDTALLSTWTTLEPPDFVPAQAKSADVTNSLLPEGIVATAGKFAAFTASHHSGMKRL